MTKIDHSGFWWGDPLVCSDTDHNARILGALFAAHFAEDELP